MLSSINLSVVFKKVSSAGNHLFVLAFIAAILISKTAHAEYALVMGSFADKSHAESMVSKHSGFNNKAVIVGTKAAGYSNRVLVGCFRNEIDAFLFKSQMGKSDQRGVWVLKTDLGCGKRRKTSLINPAKRNPILGITSERYRDISLTSDRDSIALPQGLPQSNNKASRVDNKISSRYERPVLSTKARDLLPEQGRLALPGYHQLAADVSDPALHIHDFEAGGDIIFPSGFESATNALQDKEEKTTGHNTSFNPKKWMIKTNDKVVYTDGDNPAMYFNQSQSAKDGVCRVIVDHYVDSLSDIKQALGRENYEFKVSGKIFSDKICHVAHVYEVKKDE
jgi:hypothetical protein